MNYVLIHDKIIERGYTRIYDSKMHHNHHIIPKHEDEYSEKTVPLTIKEHALVHLLRYKIGYGLGNLKAYLLLKDKSDSPEYLNFLKRISELGAKSYHTTFKDVNPELYSQFQRNAGRKGGYSSYEQKSGFFALSEKQKQENRRKGRETTVNNKLGMFSDEFREKHKKTLFKNVSVDGVEYESMTEVSKKYKISRSLVTHRTKSNDVKWKNWFYIKKENCNE